jgi:hypothetical protein
MYKLSHDEPSPSMNMNKSTRQKLHNSCQVHINPIHIKTAHKTPIKAQMELDEKRMENPSSTHSQSPSRQSISHTVSSEADSIAENDDFIPLPYCVMEHHMLLRGAGALTWKRTPVLASYSRGCAPSKYSSNLYQSKAT